MQGNVGYGNVILQSISYSHLSFVSTYSMVSELK